MGDVWQGREVHHLGAHRLILLLIRYKSTGVLSHRRCNFSVMLGPIAKEAKEKAVRAPRARVIESVSDC